MRDRISKASTAGGKMRRETRLAKPQLQDEHPFSIEPPLNIRRITSNNNRLYQC